MPVEIRRRIPRWAVPLSHPARYKGASGGRGAGRSHFFAEYAVEEMVCDPSLRFACIREVQRSLELSVKFLVESKIRAMGVRDHFDILKTHIRRRGGDGLMVFEGMQDHTAESIKSLEGFRRAWVEEAQKLSERSLDLLRPTMFRSQHPTKHSEIWFSWNPYNPTDPVDKLFKGKPQGAIHVHATYADNPFCPPELREEAEWLRKTDPDKYAHIWEGGYDLGRAGRVYSKFVNKRHPLGNIGDVIDPGGEVLVGMDFNVNPMTAVVAFRAVDECHVADAIQLMTSNTEEMAAEIKNRFPGRRVIVCPDPSGAARKTSAPVGQTDFTILERAGFAVRAPSAAPAVVDRINNSQSMYFDPRPTPEDENAGRRRVIIDPKAEALITALAHFQYKEGTSIPDKKSIYDHITSAMDYLLWQEFNVLVKPPSATTFRHRV